MVTIQGGDRTVTVEDKTIKIQTNYAFANHTHYISEMVDVSAANPIADDVLVWDGTNWISSRTKLSALSDTSITTPVDGDVLYYDSASGQWRNSSKISILSNTVVINDAGADVDFRVEAVGEPNALFVDASANGVGIMGGPANGASLTVRNRASYMGSTGLLVLSLTSTGPSPVDITGQTGNVTIGRFVSPALSASSAITIPNAATVLVSNAPAASTNVTITNSYALWVDSGLSRFDDTVLIGYTSPGVGVPSGSLLVAGKIAVGKNDPTEELEVAGSSNPTIKIFETLSNADNSYVGHLQFADTTKTYVTINGMTDVVASGTGQLRIDIAGLTNALVLRTSGGGVLGINGVVSPVEALHVNGNLYINTGYLRLDEITTPATLPPANQIFLFVRDDGVGNPQLCAMLPDGTVKVIQWV